MSDDNNGFDLGDFLLGVGLGHLWGFRSAERRARQENEWEREQLKLDKLIAKDRGQTLDEYHEWLERQVAEKTDAEQKHTRWEWFFAILFWVVIITLLILHPVETIVIILALIVFLIFLGLLLALVL